MSGIFVFYDTDNPNVWRLTQTYERQTSIGPLVVPVGFVTDLASTPRTVWLRFPRWDRWSGAAIVHDFMYKTRPQNIKRVQADNIFRELMREDGVRYGDAEVIYTAVRQSAALPGASGDGGQP